MCGIVGFFKTGETANPLPTEARLNEAAALLAHRGPDAGGVRLWPDDGLGLAHRQPTNPFHLLIKPFTSPSTARSPISGRLKKNWKKKASALKLKPTPKSSWKGIKFGDWMNFFAEPPACLPSRSMTQQRKLLLWLGTARGRNLSSIAIIKGWLFLDLRSKRFSRSTPLSNKWTRMASTLISP